MLTATAVVGVERATELFSAAFLDGREAKSVYATATRAGYQKIKPPFLAQAVMEFEGAQARISYNAHVAHGQEDRFVVCGEKGTLRSADTGKPVVPGTVRGLNQ